MKSKKHFFAAGVLLAVLLVFLALMLGRASSLFRGLEPSPLHNLILPYRTGARPWTLPQSQPFSADSAEARLLEGIGVLDQGETKRARTLFEQALSLPHSDPALPTYLHYYLNYCTCLSTGQGSLVSVRSALDAALHYPLLAQDSDLIQSLIYTLVKTPQSGRQAITLLTNYLGQVEQLPLSSSVQLTNLLGSLEYGMKRYGPAIRHFYDVELVLQDELEKHPDSELRADLILAQNYIANIHHSMGDYETAVQLYQELIQVEGDNPDTAYSHYINLIGVYLEMGLLDRAEEVARQLEPMLARLEPVVALETEACLNDLLANLALQRKDYPVAEQYLAAAEQYYHHNPPYFFPGGDHFVTLTRSKYLSRTGQTQEALALLNHMLTSGAASQSDLDRDVYEELIHIYRETGQTDSLTAAYDRLLSLNKDRFHAIQAEYLEFSSYYRDITRLREYSSSLSRTNVIAILITAIVLVLLIILGILHWILQTKNLTDQLTKLSNRKLLPKLSRRFLRTGTPARFGVVMCDIDYFKRYNDSYGHPAGDQVLRQVAEVLASSLRKKDTIIRYGGEEFLILLYDVSGNTAEEVCQRIRQRLAERNIPHAASEVSDRVSLSMGLCHQTSSRQATLDDLIYQADQCLYCAKEEGRNRLSRKQLP